MLNRNCSYNDYEISKIIKDFEKYKINHIFISNSIVDALNEMKFIEDEIEKIFSKYYEIKKEYLDLSFINGNERYYEILDKWSK